MLTYTQNVSLPAILTMQQTFNDKRVIWESKRKQVGLITVCLLFVAVSIWTRDKSSPFYIWASIIFFGGGAVFFLVRLLNPKNLFVTNDSKLGKEIIAEGLRKIQESLGFFTYTEDGFSLTEDN